MEKLGVFESYSSELRQRIWEVEGRSGGRSYETYVLGDMFSMYQMKRWIITRILRKGMKI